VSVEPSVRSDVTPAVVRRPRRLDEDTRKRLDAACNYINAELESRRRRIGRGALGVSVLTAVLSVLFYRVGQPAGAWCSWVIAPLVVLGHWGHLLEDLRTTYKQIFVRRVVAALGEGLTYSAHSRLTRQDIVAMDLFDAEFGVWRTEDEIRGRKNAVTYSIAEAVAANDSEGRARSFALFAGVIARIDFNKRFAGTTIVVPHADSMGVLSESPRRRGKEIVNLENADFEEQFTVYSTDHQQARYLITPKLAELILEAQASLGSRLRLSFRYNSLFIAFPQAEDRFEVSLFGPRVSPQTVVRELAEVVALVERLIDALELETRIWSRA